MIESRPWENSDITGMRRLPAHAYFFRYDNAAEALSFDRERSTGFINLIGSWYFKLFDRPERVSPKIHGELHASWDTVTVPHMWQFDGFGALHYTDEEYPYLSIRRGFLQTTPRAYTSRWSRSGRWPPARTLSSISTGWSPMLRSLSTGSSRG